MPEGRSLLFLELRASLDCFMLALVWRLGEPLELYRMFWLESRCMVKLDRLDGRSFLKREDVLSLLLVDFFLCSFI